MGAGASSLARLRKAIVIRSYNLKKPNQTIEELFKSYTFRSKNDGVLYIKLDDIRLCLAMDSKEYSWIEDLFLHTFGGKISEINFQDFIRFLESGKMPVNDSTDSQLSGSKTIKEFKSSSSPSKNHHPVVPDHNSNSNRQQRHIQTEALFQSRSNSDVLLSGKQNNHSSSSSINGLSAKYEFPPIPPNSHSHIVDKSAIHIEHLQGGRDSSTEVPEDDCVININLSNVSNMSLPDSVKLHTDNPNAVMNAGVDGDEGSYSIIIHASNSSKSLTNSPSKPLWRKRETVRQERTVHYTTIDEDGAQQELVEKEITQSEVLHMECRETGEFAHRETTKYEQMETFNEEVVAETQGAEEYVHLKSLEDEFHYMESTMPKKNTDNDTQQQPQQQQQHEEGGGGSETKDPSEDNLDNTDNDLLYGDKVHVDNEPLESEYVDDIYNKLQGSSSQPPPNYHNYSMEDEQQALKEAFSFVERLEKEREGGKGESIYPYADEEEDTTLLHNRHYEQEDPNIADDIVNHLDPSGQQPKQHRISKEYLFESSQSQCFNSEYALGQSSSFHVREKEDINPALLIDKESEDRLNQRQSIERSASYESLHEID